MTTSMAGPMASAQFRESANRMDIHWRLSAVDGASPTLSVEERDRLLELSVAGASLGARAVLREVLSRDQGVERVRQIVHTAVSPGVEMRREEEGLTVRLDSPVHPARSTADDLDDPSELRAAGLQGPPPPSFRTGTAFRMVSDATRPSEPHYTLAASGFVQSTQVGVDLLRADLITRPIGPRWQGGWSVGARQALHPALSLLGDAQGGIRSAIPQRYRAGVELRSPRLRPFVVQLTGTHVGPPGTLDAERIGFFVLRTNLRWRLPGDIDRWPLGQVPGAPGPFLPDIDDLGPNRMGAVVERPIDRAKAEVGRALPPAPAAPAAARRPRG